MGEHHGNTGKKNAEKPEDDRASSFIHARCRPADKAAWIKCAQSNGMKLTDWIVKNLNSAAMKNESSQHKK